MYVLMYNLRHGGPGRLRLQPRMDEKIVHGGSLAVVWGVLRGEGITGGGILRLGGDKRIWGEE